MSKHRSGSRKFTYVSDVAPGDGAHSSSGNEPRRNFALIQLPDGAHARVSTVGSAQLTLLRFVSSGLCGGIQVPGRAFGDAGRRSRIVKRIRRKFDSGLYGHESAFCVSLLADHVNDFADALA